MKFFRYIIFLLMMISVPCWGTTYFISANDGNDGNTGLSWGQAWLTLANSNFVVTWGDTIVLAGTFSERWSPQATGDWDYTYVDVIDSFRYVNGFDAAYPDTTWSATLDRGGGANDECLYLSTDTAWVFTGIKFKDAGVDGEVVIQASAIKNRFENCFFERTVANTIAHLYCYSDVTIHSSLFINRASCTYQTESVSVINGSKMELINNTYHGLFRDRVIYQSGTLDTLQVYNNIIQDNYSTASSAYVMMETDDSTIPDIDLDYNLFYKPNKTYLYDIVANTGTTISAYQTQLTTTYGGGGDREANASETNPSLQNTSSTCYILDTSPAWGTGTDKGYGSNIGYYQNQAAASSGLIRNIIFIN